MRLLVLVLAGLLFVGCSECRTVQGAGDNSATISAPTYLAAPSVVYDASLRACVRYYGRTPKQDRENLHLNIDNRAVFAGDTVVDLWVRDGGEGRSWVEVHSEGRGFNQPWYNRSDNDVRGFIKHLEQEMLLLPSGPLENLNPQPYVAPPKRKPR